ncbi:LuxR C-terminal-related transcriptional regulator [Streptomyces puniciscabiei]|uniref:LuxR C-terminal-related transcriptional regulator n=1 Tax=Streptomyces puniciscabiei TaxID=164348 RepID=UPI0006EBAC1B|nr:LuxR C-terminal-related transcriptional regulator [Streptomyces puniciscabiei]
MPIFTGFNMDKEEKWEGLTTRPTTTGNEADAESHRRHAVPPNALTKPEEFVQGMAKHLTDLRRLVDEQASRLHDVSYAVTSRNSDIREIHGLSAIAQAIDDALSGSRREILTAQPDGPRPREVLDDALESVRRHVAAGVVMRTLYQHTTRFDEATKEYVQKATSLGASVRTLDEFFDRLIIVDDVAFIAANADRTSAVAVSEPAVVGFLRDMFNRSWDRAKPFPFVPSYAAMAAKEVMPAMRDSIKRLLINGYPDKQIARRLGISERSLQGHIATMKRELDAQNRMQMGYLWGRGEGE